MFYHYTNIESLFHIIQGRKTWFNSLAFMNDNLEGFDLHRVMAEVMNLKYEDDECKAKLSSIDSIIEGMLRLQLAFCASSLRDDISQWRAYTELGQGVCIGFEDGLFKGKASKVDCIYDFEEKRKAVIENKYLKANDETLSSLLEKTNDGKYANAREFFNSIIDSLVRFKNQSFSPEKETRWVFQAQCIDDARFDIEFRPHRLGLTLYQEVDIDLNKIRRITLGPQVPSQNIKSMQDFMKINNCPAKVDTSNVSLR